MLKLILFITIAFALVVASAPNAEAANALCFQYKKSGGGISVAQVDQLPAPNKCISLALYEGLGPFPYNTLLGAGTGTLCHSRGDPFLIFHYTYESCMAMGRENYFESATCRLHDGGRPPALTSDSYCRGTILMGRPGQTGRVGNFFYVDDLVISRCDSDTAEFAVPSGNVADCWSEIHLRRDTFEQPSQGPEQQPQPSQGPEQPSKGPEQQPQRSDQPSKGPEQP
jgi:hypothetical protein